jgi:hypothetical protein
METNNKLERNKVNDLLERYFNAETTLEEEESLRIYFSNTYIETEFKKYAPLFNYFSKEIVEIDSAIPSSTSFNPQKVNFFSYKNVYFRSFSLTAAVAMAVFTYIIWPTPQNGIEMMIDGVKVNNQKLAITKSEKHLAKISSMMNLVTERTNSLNKLEDVQKTLSAINCVGKTLVEQNK